MRQWIRLFEHAGSISFETSSGYDLRKKIQELDPQAYEDVPFIGASSLRDEIHISGWDGDHLVCDAEIAESPHNKDENWFMHVGVHPHYQTRGLAKSLIEKIYEYAQQSGRKLLTISSFSDEGKNRLEASLREYGDNYPDLDIHFQSDGPRRRLIDGGGQNTAMAEGLISDDEYDEDAVWETLRDLNDTSLDHFEKIDGKMSLGTAFHQPYLVYWEDDTVIGYVVYSNVSGAKGTGIEVDGVGVNPDHQGRGIGVTMYEALLDRTPIYAGQQTTGGMGLWQSMIRSGHTVLAISDDDEIEVEDAEYYAKLIRQWPNPYVFVMTKESVLAEGANPVDGLKTFYTITDSYHGQMDGYVQAHVGDHALGYLNFSIYEGVTRIKMIEVAETYRRRGIASALYKCFVENSKGLEIEWGYTTEEGNFLKDYVESL